MTNCSPRRSTNFRCQSTATRRLILGQLDSVARMRRFTFINRLWIFIQVRATFLMVLELFCETVDFYAFAY